MRFPAFIESFTAVLVLSTVPSGTWAAEPVNLDSIGVSCLETPLQGCAVLTAGFLNASGRPNDGEPLIAWQTQMGFTDEDGVTGGFVLFMHDGEGWRVLDAGIGGEYHMPGLAEDELLHIPGYTGGTGAGNLDRLYLWDRAGEGWRAIEMHGWLATVGEMLPEGLEIWKGVEYDLRRPWMGLFAYSPLWRATDGNCCATGGEAVIRLAIEDDRLVTSGIRYLPPEE